MNNKHKSFFNKRKAFTLIELLIVIAIIGILFIVLISKVDFATDKAKATGVQTDFRSFQVAIESVAKENAGLATFGWDIGDTNGNRIRDSYDKGDTNQNGKQDPGEIFVGSKTYGETWTGIYTLTNPADSNDKSAVAALEAAINKNLDPKLHITINDDLTITMANQARDPWDTEYHGYYITNATVDNKDRGAIVIYSNGANQEFGSEHSISNGVVTVNVPGNNVYGKDDYSIAVVYTYANGYGEVKTSTSGFSQNQDATNNSNNSNNSNNGDNLGDSNNVPVIGDTKQFATLISSSTLKDLYDLSTSLDKEYGYASLAYNDNIYLCIDYFDDVYDIYYEFYNENEDYWYGFCYATEGVVNLGYAPEVGWYTYDYNGDLIKCTAPYITFVQDLIIDMPNGLSDIAPLFVEHKHNYINCECACGDNIHNYINCKCVVCGNINHNYINCECACGDIKHDYVNCECVVCGNIKHNYINCECACGDNIHNYINCKCVVCGNINHNYINCECACGDIKHDYVNCECVVCGDIKHDYINCKCVVCGDIKHMHDGLCPGLYNAGAIALVADGDIEAAQSMFKTSWDDLLASGIVYVTNGVVYSNFNEATDKNTSSASLNGDLVLPNDGSITSIGDDSFRSCEKLTSIEIPDGVTSFGDRTFWGCYSLTSITIPDSFTIISDDVFVYCYSLTSITIPDSVTEIGGRAFWGCSRLTSITIPDSVVSIGGSAFTGCDNLASVTIPDSVTSIGDSAFSNCSSLTSITIPNSVTSLGDSVFRGCEKLISITLPDSVTSIGSHMFSSCRSLTSVTIPDSVTSIGSEAFYACSSLTSITIPNRVTSIGSQAFYNCINLTSVTIPNSVTEIAIGAFRGCKKLTSVTIPNSLTELGVNLFLNCTSLTNITFNGTKAEWSSISKSYWNEGVPATYVQCSDGQVKIK